MSKKLIAAAALSLFCCCSSALAAPKFIGASIFSQNDPFMNNYATELKRLAETSDVPLVLNYAQENLVTERQQLELFVRRGAEALIVNPVDPQSVHQIISLAYDDDNLPIVFINRKPDDITLNSYQKSWYVGADPNQSGRYQAELLTQYCLNHPEADRNGDGEISYYLLQGEPNLADTVMRSLAVRDSFKTSPVTFKEAGSSYSNWEFDTAMNNFSQFVRRNGIESVEAVVANNDAMALGALQYLKSIGYNSGDPSKFIPVLGIDGTAEAMTAIEHKEMVGTVRNDYYTQAMVAYKLAYLAAKGRPVNVKTLGYYLVDGKSVYVPYIKVAADI